MSDPSPCWLAWRWPGRGGGWSCAIVVGLRRRGNIARSRSMTRSLGNRQYLVVASYEGQKFLIGVCPGRIDLLAPLGSAGAAGRRNE